METDWKEKWVQEFEKRGHEVAQLERDKAKLVAEIESLKGQLLAAEAFHKVAVAERNLAQFQLYNKEKS